MPKRLGYLWQDIVSFDNLLLAYRKARRGKQHKDAVAFFSLNLETELFTLQQQLLDGSYRPSEYRLFTIYERKPRQIAAAPFRDRVVHHALLNIVEPLLDKRFINDSYACRKHMQKVCVAKFFPVSSFNGEFAKTQRVIRGGSWNNKPTNLRSANRNNNTPDNRNNNIGFRLSSLPATLRVVLFTDKISVVAGIHEQISLLITDDTAK